MIRQYLLEGYSYSFQPEMIVSDYATKNRRQRYVFQNRDTIFNVSERLTVSEFDDFENWVQETLSYGSEEFTGAYWDSDVEKSGVLSIVDGSYSYTYGSTNNVTVNYQIELKNRSMEDGETIYNLVQGGVPFTDEYYNLFEQLVNLNNFA